MTAKAPPPHPTAQEAKFYNKLGKSSFNYKPDPKQFPDALAIDMGPSIKLPPSSGTKFDDPNYSPWDSVAKELVSGDSASVMDSYAETKKYLKWMQAHGYTQDAIAKRGQSKQDMVKAVDDLIAWLETVKNNPVEKIDTSAWHRFREAMENGAVITENGEDPDDIMLFVNSENTLQRFLIQHEWASLMKAAKDERNNQINLDDFRLPFNQCCFEMKLAGRRLLVCMDDNDNDDIHFCIAIECSNKVWYIGNRYQLQKIRQEYTDKGQATDFILDNIASMCICLEANVIETEVIRAPYKLNKARAAQGKPLVSDHTIVSLARRYRVTNPMDRAVNPDRVGTVRMHFRRGHWRHFTDHKTWIKWMLVGNPDLGFVEHEYRA